MEDQIIQLLLENKALVIGGIASPLAVYIIVETLKAVGLVNTPDKARLANVLTSFGLGLFVAALTLFPQIKPAAEVIFVSIVAMLGAAVLYNKFGTIFKKQDNDQDTPQ